MGRFGRVVCKMSSVGKSQQEYIEEVDVNTRARIASLRARGLSEYSVAEVLLLSPEHVKAVETTEEYRNKFSSEADRIIQEQIDRDEGWDGIENEAIAGLLSTMRFNKDPKFLLMTAQVANRAVRRTREKSREPTVVDASAVKPGSNIIVLNLNKTFINNQTSAGAIDVSPRPKEIPLKQSDTPAPKLVDEILAGSGGAAEVSKAKEIDPLAEMFKEAGLVFDEVPKRGN